MKFVAKKISHDLSLVKIREIRGKKDIIRFIISENS